jgi:hypothetical protein
VPDEPKRAGNRGKGRPKGAINKLTRDIKEVWEEAIAHANATPGASLRDFAVEHPEKFWPITMQLVPKKAEFSGNLTLESLLKASHDD